jgi:tRNA-dihydrouridine synthase B
MTEMALLSELKKHPFLLAPMAGITDLVFRSYMRQLGAGILTSELISAQGLIHNSEKTRKMMGFLEEERPVGIQIFGEDTSSLVFAAQAVEDMGADFVDINLGCPVKKIVSKGAGSALLKEPLRLAQILAAIKKSINIPLTIKIRTGWDQTHRNALEIVNMAQQEGVTWVAIHGRTRSQAYTGKADWDFIREVKSKTSLPIIGNGDITSANLAVTRLKTSGCDGVMIGRGCLKNPWIFRQSIELLKTGKEWEPQRDYLSLFAHIYQQGLVHLEERVLALLLRKLAIWYSSGLPGSSDFRRSIFTARGVSETYEQITEYYQQATFWTQEDTSHEAFLMGGHG